MTTNARPLNHDSAHWYDPATGEPCYEIMGKTTGRPRPVNIGDARKLGYDPSVTTVLGSVLRKPQLENYITEQAVLAALTTPRNEGEELDDFVKRVMSHDARAESQAALDIGTRIHDALEKALSGIEEWDRSLEVFVSPVLEKIANLGQVIATEKIVFGPGYAGRMDCLIQGDGLIVFDFKSCKALPTKDSWREHKLQTSALAFAHLHQEKDPLLACKQVLTGNIYISKTEPGQIATFLQEDWETTYRRGFLKLLEYWQFDNNFIQ